MISDDTHTSIFIQLQSVYVYACSLRGNPQHDRSGEAGVFLYDKSWSALVTRALHYCVDVPVERRAPEACAFDLAWLLTPEDMADAPPSRLQAALNAPSPKRRRLH